jgi:1,4-dihydroxy-2-naphthoate octaprenyltransferase
VLIGRSWHHERFTPEEKGSLMSQSLAAAIEPQPAQLANPVKRYFLATRPPFLLASLVPVLFALALAHADGVAVNGLSALLTVIGAVLVHAAANVLNDYYDAQNGTDELNDERLFPFTGGSRFIQNGVLSRAQTLRFGLLLLGAGMLIGVLLLARSGSGLFFIGLAGVVIAWAYSAPPLALNSRGLGELCIAIAFGLLIVVGTDYVQRGDFALLPWLAAVPYGLLTSSLLYINQFPDRRADAQAGKHHLVVRLGPQRARWGYPLMVVMAYGCLLALVLGGLLTPWVLLALLAAPPALLAAALLLRHAAEPARLLPAIRLTILTVLGHGLLAALGLLLGS